MRINNMVKHRNKRKKEHHPLLISLLTLAVLMSALTFSEPHLYADSNGHVNIYEDVFTMENVPEKIGPQHRADEKTPEENTGDYKLYYVLANDRSTLIPKYGANPASIKGVEPGTVQIPDSYIPDEINGYIKVEGQNTTVNVIAGHTVSAYILYAYVSNDGYFEGDDVDNVGGGVKGDGAAGKGALAPLAKGGMAPDGFERQGGFTVDSQGGLAPTSSSSSSNDALAPTSSSDTGRPIQATASYTIRFMLEDGVTPAPGVEPNPLTIDGELPGKVAIPPEYCPASLADGLYVLTSPAPASVDVKADNSTEVILTYKATNGYGYEVYPCDSDGSPLELDGEGNDIEPYYTAKSTFGETSVYFPNIDGYRKVAGQPDTVELTVYNNKENPVMINAIYEYDPYWRGAEYDVNYLLYDDESFLENYPGGSSITAKGKRLGLQGVTEFMPYFIDEETGDTYRLTADQDLTVNVVPGSYIYKDVYYQIDNRGGSNRYEITLNYKSKGGDDGHEFDYTPNPQVIWGLTEGEEINLAFYYPTEYNGYRIVELPDNKLRVGDSDKTITLEYEYRAPTAAASDNYSEFYNYSFNVGETITITPIEKAPVYTADTTANADMGASTVADTGTDANAGAGDGGDTADNNHADGGSDDSDVVDIGGTDNSSNDNATFGDDSDITNKAAQTIFRIYYYLGDGSTPLPGYENNPLEINIDSPGITDLIEGIHYPPELDGYVLMKNQNLSVYAGPAGGGAIALFYGASIQKMTLEKTGNDTYTVDPIVETDEIVTGTGAPGATITAEWPRGTKSGTRVGVDDSWAIAIPTEVTIARTDIVYVSHTMTGKAPSDPFEATVE